MSDRTENILIRATPSRDASTREASTREASTRAGGAGLAWWDIGIDGMTCAACVARVEKALGKVSGVTGASINLATERARVSGAPDVSTEALLGAVVRAGYEAQLLASASSLNLAGSNPDAVGIKNGIGHIGVAAGASDRQAARAESAGVAPGDSAAVPAQASRSGAGRAAWGVWLALLLAVPLSLPMLAMPFGLDWTLPAMWQWSLASLVQFWLGARFYRAAWAAVRAGGANMDLLVVLGTTSAYGLSIYLWLVRGQVHLYFDASSLVIALVLLGRHLERRARRETGAALRALEALRPQRAQVLRGHEVLDLPIEQVLLGDKIRVRAGETVPVDGVIVEGISELDESLLSGESRPVPRQVGESVSGGVINGDGLLTIEVTAIGNATLLARIIGMVENAQAAKAPIQRLVDQVAAIFVPVVLLLALATFLMVWASGLGVAEALLRAVAVLVIACPCSMGLATPTALMAGTGVAARHGILIRDAVTLELAHRVAWVGFDKTGTLTLGHPELVAMQMATQMPLPFSAEVAAASAGAVDNPGALQLAAALQNVSTHPLARALLRAARQASLPAELQLPVTCDARSSAGRGISAEVAGRRWIMGNAAMLREAGIETPAAAGLAVEAWLAAGHTVAWLADVSVADSPKLHAAFAFADSLRPGAKQAIARLRALGIETSMLTGDQAGAAIKVATALNIEHVEAGLTPTDKVSVLQRMRAAGRVVAMVGDGINDAPALAAADVGVTLASGTDVALQAAGVSLLGADLGRLVDGLEISRRTYRKIQQNLFWAFAYNVVGVPLAMLGLASPVVAAAAMAASSLCVVGNALLLQRWRPLQSAQEAEV